MSRPSRKRSQKRKKREQRVRKQQTRQPGTQGGNATESILPTLPSRLEMERVLRRITDAGGTDRPCDEREEAAQELAYRAYEAADPVETLACVKQALELDPDCVDAICILASAAPSKEIAIEGLRVAVAAGERKLGEDFFEENRGHFWGILETRPYMRARSSLAGALVSAGHRTEAIQHLEEMLELNPNDNLGLRDDLVGHYLASGRVAEARRLLDRFEDHCFATPAWARVLERFLAGDEPGARRALENARERNPHAEPYLSGKRRKPVEGPDYFSPGDRNEALACALNLADAWKAHPEARKWLRRGERAGEA